MNIGIISSSACAHQYASFLSPNDKIFHFGANINLKEKNNYKPFYYEFSPVDDPDDSLKIAKDEIRKCNLDYVLTSGVSLAVSEYSQFFFKEIKVPVLFPEKKLIGLESDKWTCKKILKKIGLPVKDGLQTDGEFLKDNFETITRPYVIKFKRYMYGRQTIVVTDSNYKDIKSELFDPNHHMFIYNNDSLIIEDFLDIAKEYSYHCIVNKINWQYLGSARDYKKSNNNDEGFNCVSMGAYNTNEINPIVHTYADKIISHLKNHGYNYKGFLFLQIAEDHNGTPFILEINTRNGDPEISSILPTIDNNLSEIFYAAATDLAIPDLKFNDKKVVTVRLTNKNYNWNEIATDLPKIKNIPSNIIFGLDGCRSFKIKHSLYTTEGNTHHDAANTIYDFLKTQYIGQFTYRTDIGILK